MILYDSKQNLADNKFKKANNKNNQDYQQDYHHDYQQNEPLTSVGIICIKLDKSIYNKFINNLKSVSYYNLNNIVMNNIHKFNKYNELISFMLVNRRHSLNYIDFIRGKYNINDINGINTMCSYMSSDEIKLIKSEDFNNLWKKLWLKNAYKKKYLEEMNLSKIKFSHLKTLGILNNIKTEYSSTEWEIPKGRKNSNETNLQCAIREFNEETSLNLDDYNIISCLDPIHDLFIGTNNKEYKHIFYTSIFNNTTQSVVNNINIDFKNNEIEEIRWCKWSELNDIIRPYNSNKINILTNIFLFILNICESESGDNLLITI
jgi:8-oxo-dGTP pyrophosphatase MutT (NUDIX family)